jgi:hypothetical protein
MVACVRARRPKRELGAAPVGATGRRELTGPS